MVTDPEAYKLIFKDYPDIVNVTQMSDMLGISTKTAYTLLKSNKVEHLRFGKKYAIPKLHILSYLNIIQDSCNSGICTQK